ncbi:MAG: response regulator [Deltaproteobacteria bacterium]|nr:response regulator [Deltaproteobacteria bacterium]
MTDRHRIVLALKDSAEAGEFLAALTGCDLMTVKDGASALEAALRFSPSLIAVDMDLPVIDGRRLFNILRNNQQTSRIPFLFVSDHDLEMPGIRPGSDMFFIRPYNLDEVSGRIRHAAAQRLDPHGGAKEIEGTLRQMPLSDMLQFLELNRKEGQLTVTSGSACGVVYVKDGQIYNCAIGSVEKEKALYRLLRWKDGRFEFISMRVDGAKLLHQGTGALLLEGMRQIDEMEKLKDRLPRPGSVLRGKPGPSSLPKGLNPVIYEIMKAVKRGPKVEDLVEHIPYPDYEIFGALLGLISKGAVTVDAQVEEKAEEVFALAESIEIKERIARLLNDRPDVYSAKVFLVSTSKSLTDLFTGICGGIPGFTVAHQPPIESIGGRGEGADYRIGPSLTLRLPAGFDLVFFSMPAVANMGPLMKAFSGDFIGLVLLWDPRSVDKVAEIIGIKRELLAMRQVAAVHIFAGGALSKEDAAAYGKAFGLRQGERFFNLRPDDRRGVSQALRALFPEAVKDGRAAGLPQPTV